MANSDWILGASQAAADVGTQLLNNSYNNMQASRQRRHEMNLAEYSYTKDLEMWNKANEYNKPGSQMSRLKEAGLNPNLVFGSGSVTGNTSTQTPKYQAFDPQYPQANLEMPRILQTLSAFQDIKNKKAQYDVTTQEVIRKQIENRWLDTLTGNRNAREVTELSRLQSELGLTTNDYEWVNGRLQLKPNANSPFMRKYNSQIQNMNLDNRMKKLDINLLEKGMSRQDSIIWRMMIQNGLWDGMLDKFKP